MKNHVSSFPQPKNVSSSSVIVATKLKVDKGQEADESFRTLMY